MSIKSALNQALVPYEKKSGGQMTKQTSVGRRKKIPTRIKVTIIEGQKVSPKRNGGGNGGNVSVPKPKTPDLWKPRIKKAGRALKRSFNEPSKQKERASIGKQLRKGVHSTLFKGKKKLI
jgi:hypothetical protein